MKKSSVLQAALAGLALAAGCNKAGPAEPVVAPEVKSECFGVNACKARSECSGYGNYCAGKNTCKGTGWLSMTKTQCDEAGGRFKTPKPS